MTTSGHPSRQALGTGYRWAHRSPRIAAAIRGELGLRRIRFATRGPGWRTALRAVKGRLVGRQAGYGEQDHDEIGQKTAKNR
jgi:hypothetical protein